ncbi:MAG: hypothetical protein WEB88_03425, partial [Gemmatimonadota bacterium]
AGTAAAEAPPSAAPKRKKKKRRKAPGGPLAEPVGKERPRKKKKKRRRRDEPVRPSPPLEPTDPLKAFMAGAQVPCPVGCGSFSEVVRVSTREDGSGEVWFECLSCAQRRQFEVPAATPAERKAVAASLEDEATDTVCPRHAVPVALRRRGRAFACPACGVVFHEAA